jgi:hypothetical protein
MKMMKLSSMKLYSDMLRKTRMTISVPPVARGSCMDMPLSLIAMAAAQGCPSLAVKEVKEDSGESELRAFKWPANVVIKTSASKSKNPLRQDHATCSVSVEIEQRWC